MNGKISIHLLSESLAKSAGITPLTAQLIVKELFELAASSLENGSDFSIDGLGRFRTATDDENNPIVVFDPEEAFARAVNAPFEMFEPQPLLAPEEEIEAVADVIPAATQEPAAAPVAEKPIEIPVAETAEAKGIEETVETAVSVETVDEEDIVETGDIAAPTVVLPPFPEEEEEKVPAAGIEETEKETDGKVEEPAGNKVEEIEETEETEEEDRDPDAISESPESGLSSSATSGTKTTSGFATGFVTGLIVGIALGALAMFIVYMISTGLSLTV